VPDSGPEPIDTASELRLRHPWLTEASDEELDRRFAERESASDRQSQAKREVAWRDIVSDWGTRYADSKLERYIVD
jgi:hypothetical protein